jgi:D-serine deaminase-like pyridoxal phosphate-dependent protein
MPSSPELERAKARFADQIGRGREEVTTPALILDLDKANRNIETMAGLFRDLPAGLRPHVKVHKSLELARLQVASGAIGVACATAWEAVVMTEGGIDDVLVANQVVGREKITAIAEAARDHRITVAVDDIRNVDELSNAASRAGSRLELLIELDVGMQRCGVRSAEEALPIADHITRREHVELRGLQAYEGHCMLEPDREKRLEDARTANEKIVEAADFLASNGHVCRDLSAGGTGTYFITGSHPRITEVQAGSYATMDCFHDNLVPGGFEAALTVAGTVISRQGNTVVLDCGRKAVGIDFVIPPLAEFPAGKVRYFAEEHCLVDFPATPPIDVGDVTEVMAGYGPTTVNLHDVFHVVEGGVITDIWPVIPRGPSRPESLSTAGI